jgi:hypothetical protein
MSEQQNSNLFSSYLPSSCPSSSLAGRGLGGGVPVPWQTPPELWEKLKPLARQMRCQATPAENKLWQRLRNKQILGVANCKHPEIKLQTRRF